MDSAKTIARDMLEAINVDGSGFFGAVAKGFISFPVSFYYLGYDFMDTDHRSDNFDDKMRIARLVKSGTINRETIEKVIGIFINDFSSRINITNLVKNIAGSSIGKILFSQLTGVNLGNVIATRAVTTLLSGTAIGAFITIGAESSRAIYTSRYLRERSPMMYYKLKGLGDLDLLYFLVEDTVKPFEKACEVDDHSPEEFNKICEYFFGGLII
ncbi:hypothetical protein OP862_03575 [Yersinia massiliensis]|jgi:hypothetical protein|uniref:Uncharacterized protein n=2 Tax=Yersinia TaxID=629 RepID=A0AAI8ZVA7_YERFR|nr:MULTISPECIES: hypothetical protein [Yersinia]HEC1651698.1 hypothetical protein [Yersinia enterocolitica]MDA5550350.1 hypothetical protein [Yersinia massiliensis]MDN0128000.1 hypothetical protein [Yersinia massiliensis]NIL28303.1 hypothetical protein [Yersinia massiliensis]PHZ22736.1 hypothetical protein CS535_15265 [Yersinia massiliensis]